MPQAPGSSGPGERRRGRPLQLPRDLSPFSDVGGDARSRIAWLLTVSRLLSDTFSSRVEFARALRDHDVPVDRTRLSRWESGQQPVPLDVVQGYEDVLELPDGALTGTARAIGDFHLGPARHATRPTVSERVDAGYTGLDRIDELFDAMERGELAGQHWQQLTDTLTQVDRVYLRPQSWSLMCRTLVHELARSVGMGRVHRRTAARRLLQHGIARRHFARALVQWVSDPITQLPRPVELLGEVRDRHADVMLRRLMQGPRGPLRRTAVDATARRLAVGLTRDDPRMLSPITRMLWRTVDGAADTAVHDLIARLPTDVAHGVIGTLPRDRRRRLLETTLRTGECGVARINREVVREVVRYLSVGPPAELADGENDMLERLVHEALFHLHAAQRDTAGVALGSSPYGPALATACLELSNHPVEYVAVQAARLLLVLPPEFSEDPTPRLRRLIFSGRHTLARRYLLALVGQLPTVIAEPMIDEAVTRSESWDDGMNRVLLRVLGLRSTARLAAMSAEGPLAAETAWWQKYDGLPPR